MWQVRLEECSNLRQRLGTHEFIHDASATKQLHGRDAPNLKLLRQILVLVGVHLDDFDLAGVFVGELLEYRPECATGTAPRGPEVDQNRLRGGGVDHLRRKSSRRDGGYGCAHGRDNGEGDPQCKRMSFMKK